MRQSMHLIGSLILLVGIASACTRDADHGTIDLDPGSDAAAGTETTAPEATLYDPPTAFAADPTLEVQGTDLDYAAHGTTLYYSYSEGDSGASTLEAADMGTGEPLWSSPLPREQAPELIRGVPDLAVAEAGGAAVLYGVYRLALDGTGTEASREVIKVVAVDTATGEHLWATEIDDDDLPEGYTGELVDAYAGYLGLTDADGEHLVVDVAVEGAAYTIILDADNGSPQIMADFLGSYLTEDDTLMGRSVEYDDLYGWVHYEVQARALAGDVGWSTDELTSPPVDLGGGLMAAYAEATSVQVNGSRDIAALTVIADAATGEELARFDFAARCGRADETIALCRELDEYFSDVIGVFAVDLGTGAVLWSIDTDTPDRVMPTVTAVFNGIVYASVGDESVILDAQTGEDLAVDIGATPDAVLPGFGISADSASLAVHPAVA